VFGCFSAKCVVLINRYRIVLLRSYINIIHRKGNEYRNNNMILQRCIPISAFNERLKWCHCHCSRVCPRSRALSLSRISIPAAWQKLEPSWHDSEHRRHCDASRRQFSSPCVCVCVCVRMQRRIYCKYQEKRQSGRRWKSRLNGKTEWRIRIQRRVGINRRELFLSAKRCFPAEERSFREIQNGERRTWNLRRDRS